jgi:ParB-like chromosome segregation protein Spo0J
MREKQLFKIVEIDKLKIHEKVDFLRLDKLMKEIKKDGVLKKPIVVDKKTYVVLDGHHRLEALKRLGLRKIPVIFVNYSSPLIKVLSWRKGEIINKKSVIEAAISGRAFPPKTSKHMVKIKNNWRHISFLQKKVDISLEKLKI